MSGHKFSSKQQRIARVRAVNNTCPDLYQSFARTCLICGGMTAHKQARFQILSVKSNSLSTIKPYFIYWQYVPKIKYPKEPIICFITQFSLRYIAYLTDLFTKFNEVNLQLQGDSLNLIKTKSIIAAFLARMNLMKQNIGRREFSQFPNLSMINIQDDDVLVYVQHLNVLHTDFKTRFEDVLTMEIPQWIINPYGDIEESDVILQEELIGISTNEELKVQFRKGYQQFWFQKDIPVAYPALWTIARKFLIAFPSSYLVERGFSAVANLLTKKRNRLQIIGRGDLRLYLSNLKPNIEQLLSEHQVHPSH